MKKELVIIAGSLLLLNACTSKKNENSGASTTASRPTIIQKDKGKSNTPLSTSTTSTPVVEVKKEITLSEFDQTMNVVLSQSSSIVDKIYGIEKLSNSRSSEELKFKNYIYNCLKNNNNGDEKIFKLSCVNALMKIQSYDPKLTAESIKSDLNVNTDKLSVFLRNGILKTIEKQKNTQEELISELTDILENRVNGRLNEKFDNQIYRSLNIETPTIVSVIVKSIFTDDKDFKFKIEYLIRMEKFSEISSIIEQLIARANDLTQNDALKFVELSKMFFGEYKNKAISEKLRAIQIVPNSKYQKTLEVIETDEKIFKILADKVNS